ncbi:MAG: hypothetical protein LBM27_01640 [Lactobacillaceae bacterium]|jgi:hypothetical protein|nr:hypothetical protein [Lactobacillaceae bacterium]
MGISWPTFFYGKFRSRDKNRQRELCARQLESLLKIENNTIMFQSIIQNWIEGEHIQPTAVKHPWLWDMLKRK